MTAKNRLCHVNDIMSWDEECEKRHDGGTCEDFRTGDVLGLQIYLVKQTGSESSNFLAVVKGKN